MLYTSAAKQMKGVGKYSKEEWVVVARGFNGHQKEVTARMDRLVPGLGATAYCCDPWLSTCLQFSTLLQKIPALILGSKANLLAMDNMDVMEV